MTTLLTDTDLTLVRKTAMFGGLEQDFHTFLLKEAGVQQTGPGGTVFMQDDPVTACFIVLEGWVKLYRLNQSGDEAVVSVFSQGQSFAEAAVFSMVKYPVSAEAVTEARLLRIPRAALQHKVTQDPRFALSMLASTSQHLHQLVSQIEQLKVQTGTQRVARFLTSLCPVQEGSCTIGLPYDKALIANRLGMKPESLSRAFARLRPVGVRVERNAAAIGCIRRLRNYASTGRNGESMVSR